MKHIHLLWIGILLIFTLSCSEEKRTTGLLDACSVIATKNVTIHGDTVVTCDLLAVKETFVLPLSLLVDSLEIVRLENAEGALIGSPFRINVSDNYIGINMLDFYKLFTRQGNYVATIGGKGQGPGEYTSLYDAHISEENNRIYLLPWTTRKILVYDLQGNYLEDIPLPYLVPKGIMNLNVSEGMLSLLLLPFEDMEYPLAWTQDFEGTIIHENQSKHLSVWPDYSNEIMTQKLHAGKAIDFYLSCALPRVDTLYRYTMKQNRCVPRFTMMFKGDYVPKHIFHEFPYCYITEMPSSGSYTKKVNYWVMVDKQSLKGGKFRMVIDQLGGIPYTGDIATCGSGEYFVYCVEPGRLQTLFEEEQKARPEQKTEVLDFYKGISEDDNNYVFIGKWKQL